MIRTLCLQLRGVLTRGAVVQAAPSPEDSGVPIQLCSSSKNISQGSEVSSSDAAKFKTMTSFIIKILLCLFF